jgi:hypothetical protein
MEMRLSWLLPPALRNGLSVLGAFFLLSNQIRISLSGGKLKSMVQTACRLAQ